MITNPFKYGQVVEGEYFTNREKEIREIKHEIISGQHVILISPRRYGKTSVIENTINQIKYPSIRLDMQLITDELDFANTFIKKLLSLSKFEKIKQFLKRLRIQPAIQYNNQTDKISLIFNPGENNLPVYLEDALGLPQIIAEKIKKRIIIIFDEFQEIRRISKNLEKKVRAVFQYHKDVSYIFIGSMQHMIRDIFENKNNPFYKFGKQIVLTKMDYETIKKFVLKRFASRNMDASQIMDKILDITQGHPYYTQQLCHEIFALSDTNKLSSSFIQKAIENILVNHNSDFQTWWSKLDNTERKIMIGFSSGRTNPTSREFIDLYAIKSASTAGSAIKRLQEKGIIIKKNGGTYSIEDPFWKIWIIQNRK